MDNTRNISLNSSAIASFCSTTKALLLLVFSLTSAAGIQRAWATSASTTTTLTLTSGGTAVTTLTRGSVITLTATVTAGTAPVTPGQVDFCDASVSYCTDIHLFGTAQLTSAGTATLKLLPGNGTHVYKAVFRGTTTYSGSSSTSASLTVSGTNPSVTQFSGTNLTATVSGDRERRANRRDIVRECKRAFCACHCVPSSERICFRNIGYGRAAAGNLCQLIQSVHVLCVPCRSRRL